MSPPDPLEQWTELSDLVLRTTRQLADLVLERFDLPLKSVHVLIRLRVDVPVRITDLADDVYLSSSGASRAGDLLWRRGLVERQPAPDDGRATTLTLTPSGREVAEAARAALSDAVRQVLDARAGGPGAPALS